MNKANMQIDGHEVTVYFFNDVDVIDGPCEYCGRNANGSTVISQNNVTIESVELQEDTLSARDTRRLEARVLSALAVAFVIDTSYCDSCSEKHACHIASLCQKAGIVLG